MRCSSLLLACSLPFVGHAHALKLGFALNWLFSGTTNALSTDVVSHKVAVIGAGAGGSSAAFWIAKAKARSGVAIDVDVYEKSEYIGGRKRLRSLHAATFNVSAGSTVVYPYNDTTLDTVELGGSIFVTANKNMMRATEEFSLEKIKFFPDDSESTAFWDGEQFTFIVRSFTVAVLSS